MMNGLIPVMIGGALGAGCRYMIGQAVARHTLSAFPWATLGINIIGSFLMGLIIAWFARGEMSDHARLFLAVGLLGGFTTFSSFSMEFWMLFERGQSVQAAGYVLASTIGAIAACGIALTLIRQVAP
jgi:fluoride exporter